MLTVKIQFSPDEMRRLEARAIALDCTVTELLRGYARSLRFYGQDSIENADTIPPSEDTSS